MEGWLLLTLLLVPGMALLEESNYEVLDEPQSCEDDHIMDFKTPHSVYLFKMNEFNDLFSNSSVEMAAGIQIEMEGIKRSGMLHPDEDVSIIVTSFDEEVQILLELNQHEDESECGIGAFLHDDSGEDLDGQITIGKCYNWASMSLITNEPRQINFTSPDCGCLNLDVYIAVDNSSNTFNVTKTSTPVPYTSLLLCIQNNQIIMDEEQIELDASIEWDEDMDTADVHLPTPSALSSPASTGSDHTDIKKMKKQEKIQERKKQRKQLRKENKQRKRGMKRKMKGSGNHSDVGKPEKMCPGCKGWKKWVKKQKQKKREGKTQKRKSRKMKRRFRNSTQDMQSDVDQRAPLVEGLEDKYKNTSNGGTNQTTNGQNDENNQEEDAVDAFLGVIEEDASGTQSEEYEVSTQTTTTDKEVSSNPGKNKGLKSQKRKWARKQLKKAKKGKKGKKKVNMGDRMCCKQGIQTKKLFLYLHTNKSNDEKSVCEKPSRELLIWAPHKFKTSPATCKLRFTQCCSQFSLEWLDNWKQKRMERKQRRQIRKQKGNKNNRKRHGRRAKIDSMWTKDSE